jgi:hypothetical protein
MTDQIEELLICGYLAISESKSRVFADASTRWMRRLARQDLDYDETVCGGIVFNRTPFCKWVNRERMGVDLFVPDRSWRQKEIVRTLEIPLYAQAQRDAELLRKAVVDEALPLEADPICKDRAVPNVGRRWDAVLLGIMRYTKALPELLEVAAHELDEEMRYNALESIGEIGAFAKWCAPQIARILHLDGSFWVRKEAAETLGKLGNCRVVPKLRAELGEARRLTAIYSDMGYFYEKNTDKRDLCWDNAALFEALLIGLFRLDIAAGREEVRKSFEYGSGLVDHHTKNALFWARPDKIVVPPDAMLKDRKIIEF